MASLETAEANVEAAAVDKGEATPAEKQNTADSASPVSTMSAFVVGYTGEVGREVVKELARRRDIFKRVVLIGRREIEFDDKSLDYSNMEQKQVNFDELDQHADVFKDLNVGYCCLGTTKGKSGKEGQTKVDHDYVIQSAELAKQNGCRQFHLVSSQGADVNSRVFYTKLKGQTEEDVKAVGIDRVSIYRPGVLMCDRKESRPGEWMIKKLIVPLDYFSPGFISNATSIVAKAMINNTLKEKKEPSETLDGKAIHKLGIAKE